MINARSATSNYCGSSVTFSILSGVWRSWLARQYGVLEVGSSSLLTPTSKIVSIMISQSNTAIDDRLASIKRVFNTSEIIDQPQLTQNITKYYAANHLAYWLFHSREGFMHMGLSDDGQCHPEDFLAPLKIINSYISKLGGQRILELGAGNGTNSAYLAKQHSDIQFFAVDLSKNLLGKYGYLSNLQLKQGDYHNLADYQDSSMDVIFAIETICHSSNKQQIIDAAYSKLCPGGCFIIFDGYGQKNLRDLSHNQILAKKLAEKSMAVESFENIAEFQEKIAKSHFTMVTNENLSNQVLPTMKRLERIARGFYRFPTVARALKWVLPDITKNSIAGLLMPTLIQQEVCGYYLHVLKK
jgi:SAM-dependent methyltransferase